MTYTHIQYVLCGFSVRALLADEWSFAAWLLLVLLT